ncbi:MAG: AraC family transcriptional regulator [Chitinophagaceae bacterium]|nr:MAG: AraC family transcriptional regulator [Chitinophagaceae bacterium]
MKKEKPAPVKFDSLSDAHRYFGMPKPAHPLISLFKNSETSMRDPDPGHSHLLGFYKISYKPKMSGTIRYGQGHYDFDEGGLLFAAPGQVIGNGDSLEPGSCSLYTLLIHPDFLRNFPLAKKMRQYGFFSYSTNEALHLSETEKAQILAIFQMMDVELKSRIDDFSQDVVISQIDLLLNFANRFYKRQFITRKQVSGELLQRLDELVNEYFDGDQSLNNGLPSVLYLAEHLNVSPSYLSDLLRTQTGQNAQQFIHARLIDKAKELLSGTSLSVSEIAFQLGFEHPQSFSKLFRAKAKLSPLEFRHSFN